MIEIIEGSPDLINRFREYGIIPVVSIGQAEDAVPLAEALMTGGLPCAEITFRTAAAAESISNIRKKFPEMLTGAGTVLSIDQVKIAIDSGAEFVVSPGTNPVVVEYCLKHSIPVFPGVCTPTEVETALGKGVGILKFFPAEAAGGVKYLKAICAPYHKVRFIPTGGIDAQNICDYLEIPQVIACGGSWMVKPELIRQKHFDEITKLTQDAVAVVNRLRKDANKIG